MGCTAAEGRCLQGWGGGRGASFTLLVLGMEISESPKLQRGIYSPSPDMLGPPWSWSESAGLGEGVK